MTFTPGEFGRRVDAVRTTMRERELAALCVVSPENVYYLSGLNHQGHFAFTLLVLPLEGQPRLVTRAMERVTVAAQVPHCVHITFGDDENPATAAARAVRQVTGSGDRVGLERASMSLPLAVWDEMREMLGDLEWTDGSGLVEALRAVKSPAEIEHPGIPPLIRGHDILLQEHVIGPRDRELGAGDGLFMELSGSVGRYHAPVSRMVYVGRAPAGTERAAEIAIAGLEVVRASLRPGAVTSGVYDAWQCVIDEGLGHDRYRRHHCGYLVGIGFPPSWVGGSAVVGIRKGGDLVVREGMTFHVLSWILDQQPADYVVSDTVLVTASGGEPLTTTPREPIVVS